MDGVRSVRQVSAKSNEEKLHILGAESTLFNYYGTTSGRSGVGGSTAY